MEYKEISTLDEWNEIYEKSNTQKVLVFKHSTTCPISAQAYDEFEHYLQAENNEVLHVLVKVIESRPVSNQIAEQLGVQHQSPQAILIENKAAKWDTSHWHIKKDKLIEAVAL